jgi:hypothetical protein
MQDAATPHPTLPSSAQRVPPWRLQVLAPLALALAATLPAHALTIVPTYSGVDAAAQGVINNVLANYAATFSDAVTVHIKFQGMSSGLGQSSTYFYNVGYAPFITALRADATSAADVTAMTSVPVGANPVTGGALISVTRAQYEAVGLGGVYTPNGTTDWDSVISLNFGIINTSRVGVVSPGKYDLQSVAQHEIDEVLGTVSNVASGNANIRPIDLFRYSAPGVRSFGARTDPAYLSINGGVTNLAGYNNAASGNTGDFDGAVVRVQNAFGTPGATTLQLGVEITALDVVGFNTITAVPEPGTWALMFAGLGALIPLARRRQA